MESTWASWLLVLGWVPMLLGVRPPGRPSPDPGPPRRPASRPPDARGSAGPRDALPSRRGAVSPPEGPAEDEERAREDVPVRAPRSGEREDPPAPEPRVAPPARRFGVDRPRPKPDVAPLDRILLLLTWCECAALTAVALWGTHRHPDPGRLAAGVAVFLAAIGLWLWGRAALGEHFAQTARAPAMLVTCGPFRLARHPLYLATTIACLGQAFAGGTPWGFAVWIAVVLVISLRARREERLLRRAFGPVWDAYARRTPRILP